MTIPFEAQGYAVKPVLLMDPHFVSGRPNALAIAGESVEIPQGGRIVDTQLAPATGRHEFTFACANRAELDFLETFFDAQQGKQGGASDGFWFPTMQWEYDFFGYEEPNAGQYDLYIRRVGYVEDFFPRGSQFRQLAILRGDRYILFNVESCTPAVTPTIDKLRCTAHGGSSPAPPQVPGSPIARTDDSYRMLWLRWGRLDQDELEAVTLNAAEGTATVKLAVVELPDEAPVV